RQGLGLMPYTSSNETMFLRGIAGTFIYNKLEITPFFSFRKLDASLADDRGIFTSLGSSGYHRTPSEIQNKAAVDQLMYGLNLQYQWKGLQLGTSIHRSSFDNVFV